MVVTDNTSARAAPTRVLRSRRNSGRTSAKPQKAKGAGTLKKPVQPALKQLKTPRALPAKFLGNELALPIEPLADVTKVFFLRGGGW